MSTIVIAPEVDRPPLEIPGGIKTLTAFRKWAFSDSFPETGRIDYVDGRIEVDMAAEDLFVHNLPQSELIRMLGNFVRERRLGWVFCDGARISCPNRALSVEPDVVFLSHDAYESGRATFRKSKSGSHKGSVEIVGPVDLVVEIISDSSVRKDTKVLPEAYFRAGVQELWLLDCRRNDVSFEIYARNARKFKTAKVDSNGFRRSGVLGAAFRLTRQPSHPHMRRCSLEVR